MEKRVKSGIYVIRSARLRVAYLDVSRDVYMRVKKLESDWRMGRGLKVLGRLGMKFAGDVVFEEVSRCGTGEFREKLWEGSAWFVGQGYKVGDSVLDPGVVGTEGARVSVVDGDDLLGFGGKLREIMGLGMTRRGVFEMLDKQIEYMRDRNAHEGSQ